MPYIFVRFISIDIVWWQALSLKFFIFYYLWLAYRSQLILYTNLLFSKLVYLVIFVEPRNCTWKIIEINFSFNSEDVESYKETSSHPNNKKMMDKLQTNEDSWILRTAMIRQKGNPNFRERQTPKRKNRIWLPGVCMRAQSLSCVQIFVTP